MFLKALLVSLPDRKVELESLSERGDELISANRDSSASAALKSDLFQVNRRFEALSHRLAKWARDLGLDKVKGCACWLRKLTCNRKTAAYWLAFSPFIYFLLIEILCSAHMSSPLSDTGSLQFFLFLLFVCLPFPVSCLFAPFCMSLQSLSRKICFVVWHSQL